MNGYDRSTLAFALLLTGVALAVALPAVSAHGAPADTDQRVHQTEGTPAETVMTHGVAAGTQQTEATFQVDDLTPQSVSVEVGEAVTVSAAVENTGNAEGTQDVTLTVGDITRSESTTLSPGESETLTFDLNTSDLAPNEYTHTVSTSDDSAEGSLTVEPLPTPLFTLDNPQPDLQSFQQGETVTVSVTVENVDDIKGTQEVVLSFEYRARTKRQSVTLAGGASERVTFELDTDGLGGENRYTVSTENTSESGIFGVVTENSTDNTSDSSDGSGPGLGVVAAVLALVAGVVLAVRRNRR